MSGILIPTRDVVFGNTARVRHTLSGSDCKGTRLVSEVDLLVCTISMLELYDICRSDTLGRVVFWLVGCRGHTETIGGVVRDW